MEAVLKIYGGIGEPDKMLEVLGVSDDSVSARMVSDFLDQNKEASSILVRINSGGGDVQEGWAIHDLLVNAGKPIKTIGEGKVYSIATIVFLAGTEREMMKNADGIIHNPFIPDGSMGGAYGSGDLLKIAETLQQEEEKILDYYSQRTGSDKAKLAEYMKENTKLSADDMLMLGFATKVIEPVRAFAYINPKNHIMDEKAFFEKLGAALDGAVTKIANFSRVTPIDQTLKDKDGKEFKLDKEAGAPVVGDKASPDGAYVMENGNTITVVDGVITEISEPVMAKTELELANEKIADLEAKLVASESGKPDLIAAEASFKAKEADAVALVAELTSLKNSYKPDSRTRFSAAEKVGEIDMNQVREIKKKLSTIKSE